MLFRAILAKRVCVWKVKVEFEQRLDNKGTECARRTEHFAKTLHVHGHSIKQKMGRSNSRQQRKKGQLRRPPMCAVSTLSLSPNPLCFCAYQRGRSVSCALLARGSFAIKSWFCVHLSRSFRESALSLVGLVWSRGAFPCVFLFSAELRPPAAPDFHVKLCLAARVLHGTQACA